MAEDETQRGSPKRQIARLIGNASLPIYILGEDDRVLFANDALAHLLHVEGDSLVGLDCSRSIPVDASQSSRIAAALALPPNSNRCVANLHAVWLPDEPFNRICVSLPMAETASPMMLCAIKQDSGDCHEIRLATHQSRLKHILGVTESDFVPESDLWFLRGTSPIALRTLRQIQSAASDFVGANIVSPAPSAALAVAKCICWKRQGNLIASSGTLSGPKSIVVECQLMDHELLRGTIELIDEQSRIQSKALGPVTVILHQVDLLSVSLIDNLVRWNPGSNVAILATSTATDLISLFPNHPDWGELAANLEVHLVHVPSLSQRINDIEAIMVAWVEVTSQRTKGAKKFRWTQEFLDAMLAYSWPGDIAEFDDVMRKSTQQCQARLLEERDLPIALRTYPSHIQRTEPLGKIDLDQVLQQIERDIIQQAVSRFPKNRTAAANHLGISRTRLLRRLQQLGLEKTDAAAHSESDELVFEEWNEERPGEINGS